MESANPIVKSIAAHHAALATTTSMMGEEEEEIILIEPEVPVVDSEELEEHYTDSTDDIVNDSSTPTTPAANDSNAIFSAILEPPSVIVPTRNQNDLGLTTTTSTTATTTTDTTTTISYEAVAQQKQQQQQRQQQQQHRDKRNTTNDLVEANSTTATAVNHFTTANAAIPSREAQSTTTNATTPNNGLRKKAPQKARARAARAGAAAVSRCESNQDNIDATTTCSSGRVTAGIIPCLRGLAKNQVTSWSQQQQPQRNSARTERGLRKNGHIRLGYQNQIQNELPPTHVPQGGTDDEQQHIPPARDENPPFLHSRLDASPFSQGEPIEEATSVPSSRQLSDEQAAARNSPPPTLQRGDTGLVVARAIEDDSHMLTAAHEVDAEELDRRATEKKKNRECIISGLVLIVLSLAVMIGSFFGATTTDTDKNDVAPTNVPSLAPINSPSSAPTGGLDILMDSLPEQTQENICCNNPQYKAWEWLLNHKNISNLEEWRKKQLFALGTFYYSFEGENWNPFIRERWMDYEKEECQWFSSGYGQLKMGDYLDYQAFGIPTIPSCNDNGEFTSMELHYLQLSGLSPSMPPEIALLASLSAIDLGLNKINASLSDMLPSELGQLTSLSQILFQDSDLTGTIPSDLGLIRSLAALHLGSNSLGGQIPSALGLLTGLSTLSLQRNAFTGQLPSELVMMTSLALLHLSGNGLTGRLPSKLGLMTSLQSLQIDYNALTGQLPSELGMTNLTYLSLVGNAFTGRIPSELGLLTSMTKLDLYENDLTRPLPSEVGLMTCMSGLYLQDNALTGQLPSELGSMASLEELTLNNNSLNGPLPSELGLMTRIWQLQLFRNGLDGSIPSQLALITELKYLKLESNTLTGSIPSELVLLVENGSLLVLTLANNSLSGTIPEDLCLLGAFDEGLGSYGMGLSFDCNDQLCGCCWCPCRDSNYSDYCQTNPQYLNDGWPGQFPSIVNGTTAITLNIRTDDYPEETSFELSTLEDSGLWEILELGTPNDADSINSYTMEVEFDSLYKLKIFDSYGDGISEGWFTITNYTPSNNHVNGTVVWDAIGDAFEYSSEVFIWVDSNGHTQLVEDIPGYGHALEGEQLIVVPDIASNYSNSSETDNG